jgi:predicted nuclease of predicted toxin-antitoxin system
VARFLSDENFQRSVVNQLRQLGYDVRTVQEAGIAGIKSPDEAVLALAIAEGRTVLTHDRWHFVRLHRTNPHHAGIIICTRDSDHPALAARIHDEVARHPTLQGQLFRINRPSR